MLLAISFLIILTTILLVLYVIKRLRNAKSNDDVKSEATVYTLDELKIYPPNRRETKQRKNDVDNNDGDNDGDGGGD